MMDATTIAVTIAPLVAAEIERIREASIDGLWSIAKIAKWCDISPRKARDLVNTPGFPKPTRLPSDGAGKGHPRWFGTEIVQWWSDRRD